MFGASAAQTAHRGAAPTTHELGVAVRVAPAAPRLPSAFPQTPKVRLSAFSALVVVEPRQSEFARPSLPLSTRLELRDVTLRQQPSSPASHDRVAQRQDGSNLLVERPVAHDGELRGTHLLRLPARSAAQGTTQVVERYRGPGVPRADLIDRALPVHDVSAAQQDGGACAQGIDVTNRARVIRRRERAVTCDVTVSTTALSLSRRPRVPRRHTPQARQARRLAPHAPARVTARQRLGARTLQPRLALPGSAHPARDTEYPSKLLLIHAPGRVCDAARPPQLADGHVAALTRGREYRVVPPTAPVPVQVPGCRPFVAAAAAEVVKIQRRRAGRDPLPAVSAPGRRRRRRRRRATREPDVVRRRITVTAKVCSARPAPEQLGGPVLQSLFGHPTRGAGYPLGDELEVAVGVSSRRDLLYGDAARRVRAPGKRRRRRVPTFRPRVPTFRPTAGVAPSHGTHAEERLRGGGGPRVVRLRIARFRHRRVDQPPPAPRRARDRGRDPADPVLALVHPVPVVRRRSQRARRRRQRARRPLAQARAAQDDRARPPPPAASEVTFIAPPAPPTHPGSTLHDAGATSGRPRTSARHPTHRIVGEARMASADGISDGTTAVDAFARMEPQLSSSLATRSSRVRSTNPANEGGGGSA